MRLTPWRALQVLGVADDDSGSPSVATHLPHLKMVSWFDERKPEVSPVASYPPTSGCRRVRVGLGIRGRREREQRGWVKEGGGAELEGQGFWECSGKVPGRRSRGFGKVPGRFQEGPRSNSRNVLGMFWYRPWKEIPGKRFLEGS